MPLTIPPSVNYQSPLVMIPSRVRKTPIEGDYQVNGEIDWGTMGGTDHCVSINMQQNNTVQFSQICGLSVDNSDCGADVLFIFPDTNDVLTVPAGAPKVIVEVFTNSKQFYIQTGLNGQIVESDDVTRFAILNFAPAPIAVPTSEEQALAAMSLITMDGSTTTQIIPTTDSGTLETVSVFASGPIGTGGTLAYALTDNIGTNLGAGQISCGTGNVLNVQALFLPACRLRFSGGVNLTQAGTNFGGKLSVNLLWRKP